MRNLITFKFFALIHWTPAFAGVTNDGCHCGMLLSRNPVYQKIISANFFVRSLILSTLSMHRASDVPAVSFGTK